MGALGWGVFFFVILSLLSSEQWAVNSGQSKKRRPVFLVHHVEDALPARKARELCGKLPVVSEFIILGLDGGLLHIGGGGAASEK